MKGDLERGLKENWRPGGPANPNYKDKYLKVQFTIEDDGAFTTPWTATMVYLRDHLEWPEEACAETRLASIMIRTRAFRARTSRIFERELALREWRFLARPSRFLSSSRTAVFERL